MLPSFSRTCNSDIIFHKQTTSETRWEVANKVDNIVIWIFYSAPIIKLCINTRTFFVLRDSAIRLIVLLEVGDTVDMRVDEGVGFL